MHGNGPTRNHLPGEMGSLPQRVASGLLVYLCSNNGRDPIFLAWLFKTKIHLRTKCLFYMFTNPHAMPNGALNPTVETGLDGATRSAKDDQCQLLQPVWSLERHN